MKQIILLLISVISCEALFAQVWKVGIVQGKQAAYWVTNSNTEQNDWVEIQNTNCLDTTSRAALWGGGGNIVMDQVLLIIKEQLIEKELEKLKAEGDVANFTLTIRLDSTATKITHIRFGWSKKSEVWGNLSPDRLYGIEQAIIRKTNLSVLDEEDREWFGSKADIGTGMMVRGCYLYRMTEVFFEEQKAEEMKRLRKTL